MASKLENEIYSHIHGSNSITLATVDVKQPRLRTMTLMYCDDGYFIATGSTSNKVKQLENNPLVEWILPLKKSETNGYIRAECHSHFVTDKDLKKRLFHTYDFIPKLWNGHEDPNLTVIQLIPSRYEYLRPGDWEPVFLTV
jgi:uncharacterized pyridoxamine 5'-phosphate oxidase family protein